MMKILYLGLRNIHAKLENAPKNQSVEKVATKARSGDVKIADIFFLGFLFIKS